MRLILKFILGGLISCFICCNVNAKVLTIEEVNINYSKGVLVNKLHEMGSSIASRINKEKNEFLVLFDDGYKAVFDYNLEYISYSSSNINDKNELDYVGFTLLINAILYGSEYNNYMFKENNAINYEEYGLDYKIRILNNGEKYLESFKISLDTDKLVRLMRDFGYNNIDDNRVINNSLVADLKFKDVTHNQVVVYPMVSDNNKNNCILYRSNSEHGIYEEISNVYPICDGSVGVSDNNLDNGSTYYYKARVIGSNKYSDAVMVSTKFNTTDNDIKRNPRTSDSFIKVVILGFIISSCSIIYITYKGRRNNLV